VRQVVQLDPQPVIYLAAETGVDPESIAERALDRRADLEERLDGPLLETSPKRPMCRVHGARPSWSATGRIRQIPGSAALCLSLSAAHRYINTLGHEAGTRA